MDLAYSTLSVARVCRSTSSPSGSPRWQIRLTSSLAKWPVPKTQAGVLYLVSRFSLVKAISGFEMYHVGDTMVAEVDVVLPMSFKLKEAHDLGEIITYCIESLTGIERAYIHLDYNPSGQSGHIGQRG